MTSNSAAVNALRGAVRRCANEQASHSPILISFAPGLAAMRLANTLGSRGRTLVSCASRSRILISFAPGLAAMRRPNTLGSRGRTLVSCASSSRILVSCALGLGVLLSACRDSDEPDAYGNFKTTEVVVSAETGGRLVRFAVAQGAQLPMGSVVAEIDTVSLALQRSEVSAQRAAAVSRTREVEAQVAVLQEELRTARQEYARQLRLKANDATTQQQVDQTEGQVRVITQRIAAVRVQGGTVADEAGSTQARIKQIEKRIRDSRVVNPIAGTVLVTYAEAGEFVQPGQPLYKIANLDPIILRAYVTEDQLARVRIGSTVQVSYDIGEDERRTVAGTVTFVSAQAEFTPTPIQTRNERADMVYAVEVRVPNPGGAIKIGMPGELDLPETAQAARPVASSGSVQP